MRRAALCFLLFVPLAGRAQTLTISHSGYLLDAADHPITGTVGMTFALFASPTGGTPAWTGDAGGSGCSVAVQGGSYAVLLGGGGVGGCGVGIPAALAQAPALYLEVVVESVLLAPRTTLGTLLSAAYALSAAEATHAQTSADTVALKAQLGSVGTVNTSTNPVHWSQLKGVPDNLTAGFGGVALATGSGLAGDGLATASGLTLSTIPGVAGAYTNANVTVDSQGRITAAANGTAGGGAAGLIAIPAKWDFPVGVTRQLATIVNVGGTAVTGISLGATGGFTATSDCGTTLASRAACTLTIDLPAGTAGAVTGAATVSSANGGSAAVALTGVRTPSKFGNGTDGTATVSTPVNLNAASLGASTDRNGANPDGIAYQVSVNPTSLSTLTVAGTVTGKIVDGDRLLLIDLQGSVGDGAAVGTWEFVDVSGTPSGATIPLAAAVTKTYTGTAFANQKVVVQRVPQYANVTISAGGQITAGVWDGLLGAQTSSSVNTGIVAFYVANTLAVGGSGINASFLGFRGGVAATRGAEDALNPNITSGGGDGANGPTAGSGACGAAGGGTPKRGGNGGGMSNNAGYGGGAGVDNGSAPGGRCAGGGAGPWASGSTYGSSTLVTLGGGAACGAGGGGGSGNSGSPVVGGDGGHANGAGGTGKSSGGKGGDGGPGGRGGGIVLVFAQAISGTGAIVAQGDVGGGGGGGGGSEASSSRGSGAGGGGGAQGAAGGTIRMGYGSSTLSGTVSAAGGTGGGGGGGAGAHASFGGEPTGGGGGAGTGGGGGAGGSCAGCAGGNGGGGGGALAQPGGSGTSSGGAANGGGGGSATGNGGTANQPGAGGGGGGAGNGVNGGNGAWNSSGGAAGNGGGGGGGAGDAGTSGYVAVGAI